MHWTGPTTVLFLVWMLSGDCAVAVAMATREAKRGLRDASVVTDAVTRTRGGGLPWWSGG